MVVTAVLGAAISVMTACGPAGPSAAGNGQTSGPAGALGDAPADPSLSPSTSATSVGDAGVGADDGLSGDELADGRHPGYIAAIEPPSPGVVGHGAIDFDLAVFLTGDAAKAEQKKRHPDNPEVPNDYLIINDNPKLRTLALNKDVAVKLLPASGDPTPVTRPLSELVKVVNSYAEYLYWVTVTDGLVTRIEAQWLP